MIRAWPEVEPGELDVNWHHREIADYNLDAFLGRAITAARRAPGRVFRIPGFWDSPNLEHIPLRSSRIRHG